MRASSRLAIAVSLAVAACTCKGGQSDGGVDAGSDVGVDSGHDAGRDAGRDAGTDAWIDPDAAWIPQSGVPDGCQLDVASPAAVAARAWAIEPCPDRAGCRRIPASSAPANWRQFVVTQQHGFHDGTRGATVVFGETVDNHLEAWVVDDVGNSVQGVRSLALIPSANSCSAAFFDVSPTTFAFELLRLVHPSSGWDYLFRGALHEPPSLVTNLRAPFGAGWVQEIRVDHERVAAWLSFQAVEAAETDGTLTQVTPLTSSCSIADVYGDAIFVNCVTAHGTVYVEGAGGPLRVLLDPAETTFSLDAEHGVMAWLRYVPTDAGMPEVHVMTSPYTTDRASVVPRDLARIPGGGLIPVLLRTGFGHVAVLEDYEHIGVYRMSDGARAVLTAPAGETWREFVHYIGPDEIAATSGPSGTPLPTDSALMFIRLDSLTFVPP